MSRTSLLHWAALCSLLAALFFPLVSIYPLSTHAANYPYSVQPAKAAESDENRITLAQLASASGQPAQFSPLQTPMDSLLFQFSLPPEWELEGETKLELSLNSLIASMMPSQGEINYEQIVGGTLAILINGKTIETLPIQGNGKKNFTLQLPADVWQNNVDNPFNTLELRWDASLSCNYNLLATVTIDPESSLWLPHRLKPLELDISQFPAPLIIEHAFSHPSITIILPDQPSAAELESAFTIGGGLSQLARGLTAIELSTPAQIAEQQLAQNHLIIVGSAGQSPQLQEKLSSALPGKPAAHEAVLALLPSAWNASRAMLLLQASDDQSLIKGAHAVSRAKLLASEPKTVSIIQQTQEQKAPLPFAEDTTFAALGLKDTTISRFGTTTIQIPLNIPPDIKIGAEAYLDLVFNHSQVADYLRSAIVVRLNNIPIGSVRFSDSTAGLSTMRAMLPPTVIRPGQNDLQIQVDLYPRQLCSDERSENLWVTIFSNSFLHLPAVREASAAAPQITFGNYSSLFSNPQQVAILLPKNRPAAFQAAFRLSQALAAVSRPAYQSPAVLPTDSLPSQITAQNHLLLIGLPQDFSQLPQPQAYILSFFGKDNLPSQTMQSILPFKVSSKEKLGYLGIHQTGNQTLLFISGSNDDALNNAVTALLNPRHQEELSKGNFAVIQGNKIITVNLSPEARQPLEPQGEAGVQAKPSSGSAESNLPSAAELDPNYNKPEPWLLPAILASIGLILLILFYKIYSSVTRNSKKQRL